MSILSALSKIFERITSEQINKLMAGMLSPLLSGFRQGYSTQHALFRVVEKWKKTSRYDGYSGNNPTGFVEGLRLHTPRSIDSEI